MSLIAPLSELEAVNRMLSSIGQSPVNTVDVSGLGDVSSALNILRDISRDVQTLGWSWNTDENYVLSPASDGTISLPGGYLLVEPMDPRLSIQARFKDGQALLWDAANLTWQFALPVPVRIVWATQFEELPQAVRTYIATKAARHFQAQLINSPTLDNYNLEDEQSSWLLLQRFERRQRQTNMFRRNPRLRRFYDRTDRWRRL